MSEIETVKVAFVKDEMDDTITAVFPEVKAKTYGNEVMMYVHMGQHVSGDLGWARNQETPSFEEIVPLYNELRDIGYDMIMVTL